MKVRSGQVYYSALIVPNMGYAEYSDHSLTFFMHH